MAIQPFSSDAATAAIARADGPMVSTAAAVAEGAAIAGHGQPERVLIASRAARGARSQASIAFGALPEGVVPYRADEVSPLAYLVAGLLRHLADRDARAAVEVAA